MNGAGLETIQKRMADWGTVPQVPVCEKWNLRHDQGELQYLNGDRKNGAFPLRFFSPSLHPMIRITCASASTSASTPNGRMHRGRA